MKVRHLLYGLGLLFPLAFAPAAAAAPFTVRLATAAPEGTSWAREFHAFSRDVEAHTAGEIHVKWYLGGIAGDELAVEERVKRGQVDGTASGGGLCQKLSPTMRAMRLQGVLGSHEEASWLLSRMRGPIEKEFLEHGLVFLGGPVIGRELVFSKAPLHSLAELQRARLWRWDVDSEGIELSRAAGLTIVPRPLSDGGRAFDDGELDGFLAIPASTLAFQWLPRIHHVQDWPHGFLIGCLLVSQRAWDLLSHEQRLSFRADAAKAIARVDDVSRNMDETLLGRVLPSHGVAVDHTPAALERELIAAMHGAHKRAGGPPISDELVKRITDLLAERRAPAQRP